ncbi:hypothetical protein [Streptococcus orisasini]|uniref:hypothetical protein n=1 Tax=Streptococcus orisasini TaxID=1080071 RepID=UPI0007096A08|nr:hypothetical protein [Streptococcus orisasini]
MKNRKYRRKGLVRKKEIIALFIFVSSAVLLLAATDSLGVLARTLHLKPISLSLPFMRTEADQKSHYYSGEKVQISPAVQKNSSKEKLSAYQNWIGKVKKVTAERSSRQGLTYSYKVQFSNGKVLKRVHEKDLTKSQKARYQQGQVVKLKSSAKANLNGKSLADYRMSAGKVSRVSYNHSNASGGYKYDIVFDEGGKASNIQEEDLDSIYQVKLETKNSAAQNNEILKQAFVYAKQHPGTILGLPSGDFKIGSQTPDKDYITLASDTEIRGDNTTLLIDGKTYWFALATGPKGTDGVKNFTMRNLNVKALDLKKGSQFMILANHGDNWRVLNNSFTMVHTKGSHIFDLGGLQNSVFEGNQFTGYAPDLVNATKIDVNADLHDYYSEVIQLDASNNKGVWDAGVLKAVDPDYNSHNKEQQVCNNITIANNSFVPYIDSKGKVGAYSGSIGQHSSDVGQVKIYSNVFSDSLVGRFNVNGAKDSWLFKVIHLKTKHKNGVYDNSLN